MQVTDKLRRLIAARATEDQLRDAAIAGGMITLGEDGLAKVKSGITTPEELLRVVTEVREMRTLCPQCGTAVGVDFNACPQCGKRIGGGCPHCGRALQPGWNFCPYCAKSTAEPKRVPKRLRDRESPTEGRRELPPAANVAEFKKWVALKNYYDLLEIAPSSSADEVKKAFRAQIAKYHPDKVQHLGKEFQAMAADRAAELTEAYRILGDEGRRTEYDRAVSEAGGAAVATEPAVATASPSAAAASAPYAPTPQTPPPPPPPSGHASAAEPRVDTTYMRERASRDEFVRKATMGRLRQALEAIAGSYDQSEVRGFDIALVPKKKLFGGGKNPKVLGRFVSTVDRAAVADAWTQAAKWGAADDVCVLLMGTSLAPAGELASEIRDQGRKQRGGGKLVLIPVDARDWDARMPLDAPPIAKTLLERLKKGA
jgi:curved DNA-binding protein CbpA